MGSYMFISWELVVKSLFRIIYDLRPVRDPVWTIAHQVAKLDIKP